MVIAISTTFILLTHLYVHFSILRKCSFNDLGKVSGALLGLFVVMAFVSAIPEPNFDNEDVDEYFLYLLIRSGIEEISKIAFCYVLFEKLPEAKLKHCTLTFCLILSFYEMFPLVYPLYTAAAEYWINLVFLHLTHSQLLIAELEVLLGVFGSGLYIFYNILRIYLHYKLTIFGVQWLLRKSWWCMYPVGVHGLANIIVLGIDIHVADERFKLYFYTASALGMCALLHFTHRYLRRSYSANSVEKKQITPSAT